MKSIIIALFATIWCISALAQSTIVYTFDKQGRMKSEKIESNYHLQYSYDKEGNIISKTVANLTGVEIINVSDENSAFKVYPNPTSNTISIEFSANDFNYEISVYDISGRMLQKRVIAEYKTQLSLNDYESGVYFIFINSGVETTRYKIIKI